MTIAGIVLPIVGIMGFMGSENVTINGYSASNLSTIEFLLNFIYVFLAMIIFIFLPYKILNSKKANEEFHAI